MKTDSYEPSAGARAFARVAFDMYMAMLKEGFSREDAMEIMRGVLVANMRGQA